MLMQQPQQKPKTQQFESYWDRLPNELKNIIFEYADDLTLFLNGRLKNQERLDDATKRSIWMSVFSTNWTGDLSLLPDPPRYKEYGITEHITNADLTLVSCRNLYERLCIRFPHVPNPLNEFEEIDNDTSELNPNQCNCGQSLQPINKIRLLNIPIRNMWLDLLQDLIDEDPFDLALICIRHNHHNLLLHLIETNKICLSKLISMDNRIISYLKLTFMDSFARYGHLDLLIRFHDAECHNVTEKAFNHAAENGHLDVLIWLFKNYPQAVSDDVVNKAASGGQLHVIDWLYEHHRDAFGDVDWVAPAENGHLNVIKWYHEKGFDGYIPFVMDRAANNGHLHVVKWLHKNRTEGCTTRAMDGAAYNGHLHVVKWLHENRNEGCTTDAMDQAAEGGHLHVVKFLHENRSEGCTYLAMNWAAKNDHLFVVNWLHENRTEGCTIDGIRFAIHNDHAEIVELLSIWYPSQSNSYNMFIATVRNRIKSVRVLLKFYPDHAQHPLEHANTPEVADILVEALSVENRQALLDKWSSLGIYRIAVQALERSLAAIQLN